MTTSKATTPGASTSVEITVDVPREKAFERCLPLDPRHIVHRYRGMPAVVDITEQTGPWNEVGPTRRLHLSDGSTVTEELTRVEPPNVFGYRIFGCSGPVGALASGAEAQWRFSDAGKGTHIAWTYTFLPRNALARALLSPVVSLLWRGSMAAALERTKAILQGSE